MIPLGTGWLSDGEVKAIHGAMLRIVSEIGLRIDHEGLTRRLADGGGNLAPDGRVTFSPEYVEGVIADRPKTDWSAVKPGLSCGMGIFGGYYLDPETDEFVTFTEQRLNTCFKVARHLEHIGGIHLQNYPGPCPPQLEPLYARRAAARAGGGCLSIFDMRLCPYIEEFVGILAAEKGVDPKTVPAGVVYLISPLHLARHQADQFMYFYERGYRVPIGYLISAGGTSPVTLAGAIAHQLAEMFLLHILNRILWGDRGVHVASMVSIMDMRRGQYPYGCPEMALANVAMAQMARFYQASYTGHSGLSDAKRPSVEAGQQKALTALATLMAGGSAHIAAGTLSTDEVQSPIQMILDNEFAGALKRFARGFEVNDETLAVQVMKEVGPGGTFLGTDHTARLFRSEHWMPRIWSRESFSGWQAEGAKMDADRAREIFREILAGPDPEPAISGETDERLGAVIAQAQKQIL